MTRVHVNLFVSIIIAANVIASIAHWVLMVSTSCGRSEYAYVGRDIVILDFDFDTHYVAIFCSLFFQNLRICDSVEERERHELMSQSIRGDREYKTNDASGVSSFTACTVYAHQLIR